MKKINFSPIIFGLALLVSGYWITSLILNFNQSGMLSTIAELLWLLMLGLLFFIPIVSLLLWIQEKFSLRSFYLYAFLLCLTTIVIMFASDA